MIFSNQTGIFFKKMNCKIIHCGLNSLQERESKSIKQLKSLGIRYIRIENEPYEYHAPTNNIHKNWVNSYRGSNKEYHESGLTDRHYGAWLSHKQAILLSFSDDDHSLICECDCKILNLDIFKERLSEAIQILEKNPSYHIVRFEPISYSMDYFDVGLGDKISENIYECKNIMLGHCYLISKSSKEFFHRLYEEEGWTTPDDWLMKTFNERSIPFLCFIENLTSQFDGFSEIDKIIKTF